MLPTPRWGRDFDPRCYFVTGTGSVDHIVDVTRQAARAGAGLIQVRSKPIAARDLYILGREVARAVAEVNPGTRVLIDDRVDVALALMNNGEHIHGVHVGQDDLPVRHVRALLGDNAIIGLTTGTLELVRASRQVAEVIDYIGAGPFRPTPTKDSGRVPVGLVGYPPLVAESLVPVVAIGDVRPEDAADLAATGVADVAIVRALMNSQGVAADVKLVLKGFTE
ncbi:thiamine phosphate synthase [Corynebacterium diphtheriae]|uniref:thiamine phosphate synthase n=1 Tax=Corynebacterium diphtheriae TaxID=1717 RepID=UPI0024BD3A69|nr:thiamine phosphate synthase [Corynebacterium diphtheriae]